jgi:hypothetical protein
VIDIHKTIKVTEKLIVDNSPTILTAVGVVGVGATAFFSHRAGYAFATDVMAQGVAGKTTPDSNVTIVQRQWRKYVPAAGAVAITVGAVVGANRISASRTAALAAAYVLTQEKHEEYKSKVYERFGKKKEEEVRADIAQDKVQRGPAPITVINADKVPCLDLWSMHYFESDMETIRKAVNDINIQIMNDQYASLSDFYDKLGISPSRMSDELGWNTDSMLEVSFNSVLKDDKIPVLTIDFEHQPIRGYGKCY